MNVGEITMWFDIIKSDKRDYDKEFKDAVIKKIHNETKINRFLNAYNNSKVKDIYIEPNDRHPLSAIQKQRILESNFSTPQLTQGVFMTPTGWAIPPHPLHQDYGWKEIMV